MGTVSTAAPCPALATWPSVPTVTLMSRSMSASRLTMVILCMTMSKIRRSRDCHLSRAALLKVWLVPFLGNFFLQPEGRRGSWVSSYTMPGKLCLPQKDAWTLAGQAQRKHLHHGCIVQLSCHPLATTGATDGPSKVCLMAFSARGRPTLGFSPGDSHMLLAQPDSGAVECHRPHAPSEAVPQLLPLAKSLTREPWDVPSPTHTALP